MILDKAKALGIHIWRIGNTKTICPWCSHLRKNKRDKCLSVKYDGTSLIYNCHHCSKKGGIYESDTVAGSAGNRNGNSDRAWFKGSEKKRENMGGNTVFQKRGRGKRETPFA